MPERLEIQDLDGDGKAEVVVASQAGIWVTDGQGKVLAQEKAEGHPQVMAMGDPAGKNRGAFVVGWGSGRRFRDVPVKVILYRYQRGRLLTETIHSQQVQRATITSLRLGRWKGSRGLLLGYKKDKYNVQLSFAAKQGAAWQVAPIAVVRMGQAAALGAVRQRGGSDLVIGRLYGDKLGDVGDAFLWAGPDRRIPIPVEGGVRAVATADLDGNGVDEVLLGDGWRQAYGRDGRARIKLARFVGGKFVSEKIGELTGQYMVQKIVVGDLDGDRRPDLLVVGNATVTVFHNRGKKPWTALDLAAGQPQDAAMGDLDGDGKPDVLVLDRGGVQLLRNVKLR
ncbi:MAG: VCBS repeat-containing protein [bacterium]